jgi:hypothetical protein
MYKEFSEYRGKFVCHECKELVLIARFYGKTTMDITWLCSKKHLSRVNLNVKGY